MYSKTLIELCVLTYSDYITKKLKYKQRCLISKKRTVVCVYERGDVIVIVFRGTDDISDLIDDFNCLRDKTIFGTIHRGFHKAFLSVYEDLLYIINTTNKRVYMTGHSLGGALATLCAVYFKFKNPILVTFGSPRVGLKDFVDLNRDIVHIRWANKYDLVCKLPPNFKHFGEKKSLKFGFYMFKSHNSKRYLYKIIDF